MSDGSDEFDFTKLDKLIMMLSDDKVPTAKIGILGDKNSRKDGNTNAAIGAKHEFGEEGMPIRSFLRMPIAMKLQGALDESGAFDEAALKECYAAGTIEPWVKKLAIMGEAIVLDAFETGGFGQWKPSDFKHKTNHQTLVETQQLRNSITSEVK